MAAPPPASTLGWRELGALLRRRRWWIAGSIVGVWGLALALAAWLPPRYRSQATLLITPAQVPATVVGPPAGGDDALLEQITQQVLSRPRLARLAARWQVFAPGTSREQAGERMRQAVELNWVTAPGERQGSAPAAFTVAFNARSPRLAQVVDRQLSQWFIQSNQRARQAQAAGADRFLQSALAASRARLQQRQQALQAFRAQHPDLDPAQAAASAQQLTLLESQQSGAQQLLDQDRQEQTYLGSLEAEYRQMLDLPANQGAAPAVATALDQHIAQLQARLAALRTRYTDRYPEVQRLQAELAAAQRQRRRGDATAASPQQVAAMAPLLQLQSQAQANQLAIRNEQHHLVRLGRRIAAAQAQANAAPVQEQQLAQLEQQDQQAQADYDHLTAEQHQARLAVALDNGPSGAHFRLLDPPTRPLRPAFPNPLLFSGLGLALGAALGVLLALARDWSDDRLHGEREARAWAAAPVLGAIPALETPAERRQGRLRSVGQWLLASALLLVVAAGNGWLLWHS
jgi:succinoglycan biosynthesis transport protein ExoP